MAGPFEENDYLDTIPSDKKLDPQWVQSLFARGEKQTYSDPAALGHIGMPVGGLFAGTVYLSGDGRLWLWDIFNRDQEGILPRQVKSPGGFVGDIVRGGANFVEPAPVTQPFQFGFSIRVNDGERRTVDSAGFRAVVFDGRYPAGHVSFRDEACPVTVNLDAYSPFIPLDLNNSSLPATVLRYTVKNNSGEATRVEFSGHLENVVGHLISDASTGRRRNRVLKEKGLAALVCDAVRGALDKADRQDILFDDFEREAYGTWTAEGTSFGSGPIRKDDVPDYQGDLQMKGSRCVNSHASAPGNDVRSKDGAQGTLVSRAFKIERNWITMLVGGGNHAGKTCVNLIVDDKVVGSLTGNANNCMERKSLDTRAFVGKQARLKIVDHESGDWGNIGVDEIVFTDIPPASNQLELRRDNGSMTLARVQPGPNCHVLTRCGPDKQGDGTTNAAAESEAFADASDESLVGAVLEQLVLAPGEEKTVDFVVTWHFPNLYVRGLGGERVTNHYATRFNSATAVARHVAENWERLTAQTQLWVKTWYDSTVPYWLLDRTMANTSTLATTTCYRLGDGRFWAWEGVGCCEGTCTHVWHYAQAMARLFPEMERDTRARVDFGLAQHPDGGIGHRASLKDAMEAADDGQCGRILGAYREHLMSSDDQFLKANWPRIQAAIEYLIRKDSNQDGMIEDAQPNTLDAAWYGKVSFLASLYVAALRASAAMAGIVGDQKARHRYEQIAERGATSILQCYNGEYFHQIEDEAHRHSIGVGAGCYIDQVFGQTWAHWVGLKTLFDRDKQLSALRALWKYNFVPDIGRFRKRFPRGRWYAMAGDAGLIMCSWPKGGRRAGAEKHWQYMYFNECMTGFEWQVAAHMIWEGIDQADLLQSGLAVARAIHDRYDARLRNPYNEIECSDHYSRAMASYGVFLAVCGFHYDGPKREIGFQPRLTPETFRAPFTSAEGWGTYQQTIGNSQATVGYEIRWGTLSVKTIRISIRGFRNAVVRLGSEVVPAEIVEKDEATSVVLRDESVVTIDKPLTIEMTR